MRWSIPPVARRWAWLFPLVAMTAGGMALAILAWMVSADRESHRVAESLTARSEWRTLNFQTRIESGIAAVGSMAGLVTASRDMSQPEFVRDAEALQRTSALRRLSWSPLAGPADRDSVDASIRLAGHPGYRLRESTDGLGGPPATPSMLLPVALEWHAHDPLAPPRPLAGEIRSRPGTSPSALHDSATAAPVGVIVTAANAPAAGALYVVFWPVFEPVSAPEAPGSLRGYLIGSFDLMSLLRDSAADTPAILGRIQFLLGSDTQAVAEYDLLASAFAPGPFAPDAEKTGGIRHHTEFTVAGERWRLLFDYPPRLVSDMRSSVPFAWGSLGLLLTSGGLLHLVRARRRIEETRAVVAERTSELARVNVTLQSIIDSAPVAIILMGPDRRVVTWSRGAEAIFGYRAEEVLGKPHPLICDENRAIFEAGWARVCAGETVRDAKRLRRAKDGRLVPVRLSSAPLYEPDGRLRGIVTMMEDVTDAERIAAQLAQAQKMEAIGQLTGGMAHDFNNLLGIVIGNLELLQENLGHQGEDVELCGAALDASMRGTELVRQLLAFARRQPLQPARLDLVRVVSGIVPLLARTLGERIAIATTLAPDLAGVTADRAQLESAIVNLAINARDAMPDGGSLEIDCRNQAIDGDTLPAVPDLASGDYAVISVTDHGTGIAPELLGRVFDPFFTTKHSDDSGTRGGTGLGLSMVYGFMKQSGGTVTIYSERGIGTTVRLYLPRSAAGPVPMVAPGAVVLPRGAERILVVEDNHDLRKLACRAIGGLGYRIAEADCARAALAILDAGEGFDLLFTDVVMPGAMSGIDMARAARERSPSLKILFTSGFTSPAAAEEASRELCADLIVKPYRRADLALALRRAIDGTDAIER